MHWARLLLTSDQILRSYDFASDGEKANDQRGGVRMSLEISDECKKFLRDIEKQLEQSRSGQYRIEVERIYYSVQANVTDHKKDAKGQCKEILQRLEQRWLVIPSGYQQKQHTQQQQQQQQQFDFAWALNGLQSDINDILTGVAPL